MSAARGEPGRGTYLSIQYLRGAAALLVAVFHVFSNRIAAPWAGTPGLGVGMWGVDVFFVISGFIMWRTARAGLPAGRFLWRRVLRVFPLYWIVLTAWIAARLALPDALANADVTPRTLALSYLLVPHAHAVFGLPWPILTAGWTLQLELFFYAAFALVLHAVSPARRLPALLALLAGLAGTGLCLAPRAALAHAYTDPLLLEFAGGVALAAGVEGLARLPRAAALALVLAAVAAALPLARYGADDALRPFALGLPALALVAGMLAREGSFRARPSRAWLALGDASYSLYLTHPLAIAAAAVAWHRLGLPEGGLPNLAFVPAATAAAVAAGLACHRLVEAPLLRCIARPRAPRVTHAPALAR